MNEQQLLELKLKINETEKKIESLKEEFEQDYDPDHAEIYEEDIEDQEKILKGLQLEYKNAFEKTKPIIKKRLNDLLIKNNFSEETIVKKKPKLLKREVSSIVTDQGTTSTCWNFSSAKCILRHYRNTIPELFGIDSREDCNDFYNFDYIYDVFDVKTESKIPCSQNNYNSALLFGFIFSIFSNKYGNVGNTVFESILWFFNTFTMVDLPKLLNNSPKHKIIKKIKGSIHPEITPDYYSLKQLVKILRKINAFRKNTIFYIKNEILQTDKIGRSNFICFIKKIIDTGYYCIIDVPVSEQRYHAMTIVGYEETDDFFILVKNSWGEHGGSIVDDLQYKKSKYDNARKIIKIAFSDINSKQVFDIPIIITHFELQDDYQHVKTNYIKDIFLNINNLKEMKQLLKKSILSVDDLSNYINDEGYTLLSYAIYNNNVSAVRALLERGIHPNKYDITGNSPLFQSKNNDYIVKLLLEYEATTNMYDINEDDETLLHIKILENKEMIVKLLLENKSIDINAASKGGATPLMQACDMNNKQMVKLLLDKNADVNIHNEDKIYPIHLSKNKEIIKLLLKAGADINTVDKFGANILHKTNNPKFAEFLLGMNMDVNSQNDFGQTALHIACKFEDLKMAKFLSKIADIHVKNKKGHTPLDVARSMNFTEIVKVLEKKERKTKKNQSKNNKTRKASPSM
jgi:ankyrin repeat protein